MKRISTILIVTLLLTFALAITVSAEVGNSVPQWFQDMMTWKKAQVEQALNDGLITKDQAKAYIDQIDAMEKWHVENGFPSGAGYGGCHGLGYGQTSLRGGFGYGMMRGYLPIQ